MNEGEVYRFLCLSSYLVGVCLLEKFNLVLTCQVSLLPTFIFRVLCQKHVFIVALLQRKNSNENTFSLNHISDFSVEHEGIN